MDPIGGIKDEFIFFNDAKDHFKVEENGEQHCLLLIQEPFEKALCSDGDCRKCSIASNSYLVGLFQEKITQEKTQDTNEEMDEIDRELAKLTPEERQERFAEGRRKRAAQYDQVAEQMLKEMPAKKWTKDMVKAYCSKNAIEPWYVDELYGRIKISMNKENKPV